MIRERNVPWEVAHGWYLTLRDIHENAEDGDELTTFESTMLEWLHEHFTPRRKPPHWNKPCAIQHCGNMVQFEDEDYC